MSTSADPFTLSTDSDIRNYVRTITGYDDSANELPQEELNSHIGIAKGRLASQYGFDASNQPWFSDVGLGLALVYTVCIDTKITTENYSVKRWDFGDESITTKDSSESAQLNRWLQFGSDGLDNSDVVDNSDPKPQISADYDFRGNSYEYDVNDMRY